jgi:hypothetical protein
MRIVNLQIRRRGPQFCDVFSEQGCCRPFCADSTFVVAENSVRYANINQS